MLRAASAFVFDVNFYYHYINIGTFSCDVTNAPETTLRDLIMDISKLLQLPPKAIYVEAHNVRLPNSINLKSYIESLGGQEEELILIFKDSYEQYAINYLKSKLDITVDYQFVGLIDNEKAWETALIIYMGKLYQSLQY